MAKSTKCPESSVGTGGRPKRDFLDPDVDYGGANWFFVRPPNKYSTDLDIAIPAAGRQDIRILGTSETLSDYRVGRRWGRDIRCRI